MQMPHTPNVFISYARADTVRLARFVPALQAAGCAVWMDEGKALTTYQELAHSLEDAIRASDVMVVALSPAAVDSRWVRREIQLGLSLGKPIIPVVVRAVGLPSALKNLRAFDLYDAEDVEEKAAQLIGTLDQLAQQAASSSTHTRKRSKRARTEKALAPELDSAQRLRLA